MTADIVMVRLDESKPETFSIPRGTQVVCFENPNGREIVEAAIADAVRVQPGVEGVERVCIGWNSQITSANIIGRFPNVQTARLEGPCLTDLDALRQLSRVWKLEIQTYRSRRRTLSVLPELRLRELELQIAKPCDIEFLAACRRLSKLTIRKWPEQDLRALSSLKIARLLVVGGHLQSTSGICGHELESAEFAYCPRLTSLEGVSAQHIHVQSCKRVDYATIGSRGGPRSLRMWTVRPIESFEFIRRLVRLEYLEITATRVVTRDYAPLIKAPYLREVFFMMPAAQIAALAQAKPALLASNGKVYWRCGKPCDWESWGEHSRGTKWLPL